MENSTTEARNEATMHLDEMTVEEALITMNKEDQQVPLAVRKAIPQLTKVIKKTIAQYKKGWTIDLYRCRYKWKVGCLRCSGVCTYIQY